MVNAIIRMLKWLWPLGVVLLVAGFGVAIKAKEFTDLAATLSILGVVLFLTIFVRGESSNVKFYINVVVASVLSLGILIVLYMLVSARDINWDVTKSKRNSLSDQTVSILENLKAPVRLIGFYNDTTNPSAGQVEKFLDLYSSRADDLQVEMVDPVKDNRKVLQYKERFGTEIYPMDIFVVNESEEEGEDAATQPASGEDASALAADKKPRFKRVMLPRTENPIEGAESPVTNAIVEVTQEKQVKVYVLQGPGYKTLTYEAVDKSRSMSELKTNLGLQAIEVEPLQLRGDVPQDCTILMAAGIQNDLFPAEMETISKFLDRGGKLLLYFNAPDRQTQPLTNWTALLERHGIRLTNDYVMDVVGAQNTGDPTVFVTNEFDSSHPITKDLTQARMAFRGVRALKKVDPAPTEYTVTELVKSSPQSWSESYESLLKMMESQLVLPGPDAMAPQALAMSVGRTGDEDGAQMVVFGNAEMISDNGINNSSFTLTTLAINWLGGNAERLAIPPRVIEDTPLYVTEANMHLVFVLVVLSLPAILFFGGLSYTMLRRRSR